MRRVAIVGRPNVGKSALFNRLVGRQISIVHDQPGVTRDRIASVCKLGPAPFELTDTGGIGADPDPEFTEDTRVSADFAIAGSDLLLFVVDAADGLTPLDGELAKILRSSGRPTILVVNKVDVAQHEDRASDFARLGFERTLAASAAHGRGIGDLVDAIASTIDLGEEEEAPLEVPPLIAIVGRPNVGKSSLINAILGDRRTIVSNIAGTTRDAVDIPYRFKDNDYILCDTAGIRHRSKHNSSVEVFSVMRSEKAIRRADLAILVIDASQGVTSQDRKIAGLIQEAGKACLIVLNKWDLVAPDEPDAEFLKVKIKEIRDGLFFLDYAPLVMLSALDGRNLPRLFNAIEKMREHAARRMGTGELNRILQESIIRTPPPMRGSRRFKILYATQIVRDNARPFSPPQLLLFVNDPLKLPDSYQSYLTKRIRDHREYPGLPILIRMRGRKRENEGG